MRLPTPTIGAPTSFPALGAALKNVLAPIVNQLNNISEGRIGAVNNASTAPPPAGSSQAYAQGDFVRNTAPVELGAAGSKYIITGWTCVAGGTPGTWVASRCPTGN